MIKKLCIVGFGLWVLFVCIAAQRTRESESRPPQWILHFDELLELPQVRAFLDVIAYAEGTCAFSAQQLEQECGYKMLYGGGSFSSFHDHPRKNLGYLSNKRLLKSTAAGRYQILARTWDTWAPVLQLRTFSPKNQDKLALALIRQCGALQDVIYGRYQKAFKKVCSIWASLPGAPYGQRVLSHAKLIRLYNERLMFYYTLHQKSIAVSKLY
jgi:muramidase (phage lysozyme)